LQAAWALYEQFTSGPYLVHNPTLAMQWLRRAAELGSGQAACQMAQMLDRGDPLAGSAAEVLALLEQLSSQDDSSAQASLASWHLEGKHGLNDKRLAMNLLRRAAHAGNSIAQACLGDALATGHDTKANLEEAAVWYEMAALQGHEGAIRALTKMIVTTDESPEALGRLFRVWLKSAEAGNADAQRVVGDFYMRGKGVERSPAEGERWLNASIEQGNAAAMVLLGGRILENLNEPARFPAAVNLFLRAATLGNIDAEYNLGVCLRRGLGVEKDLTAAEEKYRLAAKQNHVSAQLALGDVVFERAVREADWTEAAHWYQLAADGGSTVAKESLMLVEESRLRHKTDL